MRKIFVVVILLFSKLASTDSTGDTQRALTSPPNCELRAGGTKLVCDEIIDPSFAQNMAESTELM